MQAAGLCAGQGITDLPPQTSRPRAGVETFFKAPVLGSPNKRPCVPLPQAAHPGPDQGDPQSGLGCALLCLGLFRRAQR